ncbi:LamB/YcsF family protein [Mycolicibacterium sp.]|uniref:LamB/YcsF family protein n=1 Tax=Mycolicibacterium sp. TaxID=2320850 RepID=UPI003D1150A2
MTSASAVDLVADIGEGFGAYRMSDDDALLEIISAANIACGFHAGDPRTMAYTVERCAAQNVSVGAHPSFPDRVGFGRRDMGLHPHEVETDTLYQIGALSGFARAVGVPISHVIPHGRLGNLVVERADYATAVAEAVHRFDRTIAIGAQEGELRRAARARDLPLVTVGFIDRAYEPNGQLRHRRHPDAVLHDAGAIVERAIRMVADGEIEATDGTVLRVDVGALLLHGDNPGALTIARAVRTGLESAGVQIGGRFAAASASERR